MIQSNKKRSYNFGTDSYNKKTYSKSVKKVFYLFLVNKEECYQRKDFLTDFYTGKRRLETRFLIMLLRIELLSPIERSGSAPAPGHAVGEL